MCRGGQTGGGGRPRTRTFCCGSICRQVPCTAAVARRTRRPVGLTRWALPAGEFFCQIDRRRRIVSDKHHSVSHSGGPAMAVPLTCPNVVTLTRLVLGELPPDEIANLQEHLALCPECLKNLNDLPTDDPLLQAMRTPPAAGPEEEAVERLMERLRC